jgi:ABC-type antimicrobial peptide transport system permease subunit
MLGQPRFLAAILAALGLLTIALSAVGILGVVNHVVVRRKREMGIRAALGADGPRLRRMVMRRATSASAIGIAVGSMAALWWTSSLRALLHGFRANDASAFLLSGLFVLLLVAAAALVPAWRASRVEPVVALRAE